MTSCQIVVRIFSALAKNFEIALHVCPHRADQASRLRVHSVAHQLQQSRAAQQFVAMACASLAYCRVPLMTVPVIGDEL